MAAATKPEPIRNREAVTDFVCEVMHDSYRDVSIDALLARPFDAVAMALKVLTRSGLMSKRRTVYFAQHVAELIEREPELVDLINTICRTALRSRKAGDLRKDRY